MEIKSIIQLTLGFLIAAMGFGMFIASLRGNITPEKRSDFTHASIWLIGGLLIIFI